MSTQQDAEVIRKQNEESQKLINQMIDFMRTKRGYNSSNDIFSVGQDASGRPVLELGDAITPSEDLYNFDGEEWHYGAFYLDSSYPKMGLYTSSGKFIPTENKVAKSEIVEYKTPQQLANAIIGVNDGVDGTKVSYKGDGDGTIQIEGVIDHIELPTTDLRYEVDSLGHPFIYSTIYPDRVLKVELIRSAEKDINNIGGTGTATSAVDYVASKRVTETPLMEENNNKPLESNGGNIAEYGPSAIRYADMLYAFNHFTLSEKNELYKKDTIGDSHTLNTLQVDDNNRNHALLKVAHLWAEAWEKADGGAYNGRNEIIPNDDSTGRMFDEIMRGIATSTKADMSLESIANVLYSGKFDRVSDQLRRAIIYFLANPEIAPLYNIQAHDKTPADIISDVERERDDARVPEIKIGGQY